MNFRNSNLGKILKIILILLVTLFIFKYILRYFTPFILGYILCLLLYPITRFLIKAKMSKELASFISIILFLTIISFIGTTLVSTIIQQAKSFANNFNTYVEQVEFITLELKKFIFELTYKLPLFIQNIFYTSFNSIIYFIKDIIEEVLKVRSVGVIKKIPNFFMVLIIALVSCFFILSDKENIEGFILRQIPKKYRDNFKVIKEGVLTVILGYIKAQLIIMSIMTIICFTGLIIIKAPYALLLALIVSFVDALPILGSGTIFIPWAIYNLIIKNYSFGASLFIIYLIMVITRQFIEHKIIGKQIGLHPLVTLISIYVGLKLLGIIGIIVAPIFVVMIKFLQEKDILPRWK